MNSRSASSAPAATASDMPAPITPRGFVVRSHRAAIPPVARMMRRRECPPSRPRARLPRRSASKRTPSRSRSRTRSGESSQSTRTALSRAAARPAATVSAAWRPGESSSASAAAIPPGAQYDAVWASGERLTSATRAPPPAAVSAAYRPAAPAPTTATSARRESGSGESMAARRYGTGARASALQPSLLAAARDRHGPPRARRPDARDPGGARAPRLARLRAPRGPAGDREAAARRAHTPARGRGAGDERARRRVRPRHADLGNGTNSIFHSSPEVLFASIHQYPFYPGTGPLSDVGSGDGEGFSINLPVPAGAGEDVFCGLVEHVVPPAARGFDPDLGLVAAGFDAHRHDPVGGCALDTSSFAELTRQALTLGKPVGCVLEGGYDLDALAGSVAATMEALADGGEPS